MGAYSYDVFSESVRHHLAMPGWRIKGTRIPMNGGMEGSGVKRALFMPVAAVLPVKAGGIHCRAGTFQHSA